MTDCKSQQIIFQGLDGREVVGNFEGGKITSDAGGLLLREANKKIGLLGRFAQCFVDYRRNDLIEHTVLELVSQRVYGICLGYEDLNDHEDLRRDLCLSVMVEKRDVEGIHRRQKEVRGIPLAGKSTLNRLELTPYDSREIDPYHKIVGDLEKVDDLLVNVFLESHPRPPQEIIIDLDNTDDPLHGHQEGRYFHGYYDCYCYTPLYIFCGEHLLLSRLSTSNVSGPTYAVAEVSRIIAQIRKTWPEVKIILRGDSDFSREELMRWCEENSVDYVFGLAKNNRLIKKISKKLSKSKRRYYANKKPTKRYQDFRYQTLESWSKTRRVVGKAEYLAKGANPRFIVTSLPKNQVNSRDLYEKLYCARGDMENRIKEQQMDLFADRTSTQKMRSNQLRLYFSSMAYVLLHAIRRLGLQGTEYAKAQCGTIRTKLFKIGAQIKVSFRRIFISMATGCPYAEIFSTALSNLQKAFSPLKI